MNRHIVLQFKHSVTVLMLLSIVTVTAYDAPCKICGTRARTSTGKSTRLPGAASGRWAVGTVLHIQGIGRRVVDDRCRSALDVRFTGRGAHKRAREFGRKSLKVRVLKFPNNSKHREG